jgi:hypothetical protein
MGFGNVYKFVNSESKDWEEEGVLFIQEVREELRKASTIGRASITVSEICLFFKPGRHCSIFHGPLAHSYP